MVQPIPEGYSAITPYLVVKGALQAMEFYSKAFGATELMRLPGPGDTIMHAEIQIGDSRLMLADEFPDMNVHAPAQAWRFGSRDLILRGRRRQSRSSRN